MGGPGSTVQHTLHVESGPTKTKKHVHFGRSRRKASVGPDLGHSSASAGSPSNIAADILEWLRPRALSDQISKHRRKSVDSNLLSAGGVRTCGSSSRSSTASNSKDSLLMMNRSDDDLIKRPLFVDAKLASSWVNNIPQECLYQRGTLSAEQMNAVKPFTRPRSNSELGRYLLVRRSRELNGKNDVVGRFVFAEDRKEQAYCQLLSTMTCYDVMPQFSRIIVLQSTLSIRKAFMALVSNSVRAAVVINPQNSKIIGVLTVTDLINVLLESTTKKSNSTLNLPLNKWSFNEKHNKKVAPIILYINDSLYKATKLLCQRSVHRLIILDSDVNGNPVFLLSKKMILSALQKYISLLPLPSCMHLRLDVVKIGTWDNFTVANLKTTVHKAMLKFLGKNISSLPVVDGKNCVLDVLTKVDLMNLVTAAGTGESILQKTVEETINERKTGAEKMVTCHARSTLLTAVELLLKSNAHRLMVVDEGNKLQAIIAVTDLMLFLIGNV